MLRDLQLRAMAGLGIALKDFLVLSKLQEITPGAKLNLACPYFSSEEVTCRIARVTDTKVDRLEHPLFIEEVNSPELPGGKDVRPVDLSQEQLKELIQRYPDIAQISDRVVSAQYYPFGYGVSMPTWDQDEFVPSQGQSCVVKVVRTLVNAEELWSLHQGRRNKPEEILGIKR